jgi:hypothetical protein
MQLIFLISFSLLTCRALQETVGFGTSDEHPRGEWRAATFGAAVSMVAATGLSHAGPSCDDGGDGQLHLVAAAGFLPAVASSALCSPAAYADPEPPMAAPIAARPSPEPSPPGGKQLPLVVRRPCDSPLADRPLLTVPSLHRRCPGSSPWLADASCYHTWKMKLRDAYRTAN